MQPGSFVAQSFQTNEKNLNEEEEEEDWISHTGFPKLPEFEGN